MHKRERVGLKQQNTFSPLGTDINKRGRKRSLYKVTEPLRKKGYSAESLKESKRGMDSQC